jgi:hypothetical protein
MKPAMIDTIIIALLYVEQSAERACFILYAPEFFQCLTVHKERFPLIFGLIIWLGAHLRLIRSFFPEAFEKFRAGGVALVNTDRVFAPDTASGDIGREGLVDLLQGADNVESVVPARII